MWQLTVVCSDERCGELLEVVVEDLDEVERVVCACGHNVVLIGVAAFKPLTLAA